MNILDIAGSDPSAGAGIQSDIKTFSEFGCHGLTAVTAITSQNTSGFSGVKAVPAKIIAEQLDSILSDFQIDAVKIGMVFGSPAIKAIYYKIKDIRVPIVLDPVIKSTTGGVLLKENAISDFRKFMIPISTVITPNTYELKVLSGNSKSNVKSAVKVLKNLGAKNVIVTGVIKDGQIHDCIFAESGIEFAVSGKKVQRTTHGSGCSYSAALVSLLAKGNGLEESVRGAKQFATASIIHAKKIGGGIKITSTSGDVKSRLGQAITEFAALNNIWNYIPQCQTNFVFAKSKPKSIRDILGLDGRIVRTKNGTIVAGEIMPGGSKHVASAVLQMNKKFPRVRSGVNIRYSEKLVKKIKKTGMKTATYDRCKEPQYIKKTGSSISWGIKKALMNAKTPYDAIYHAGDVGKEPMIIVFGADPQDVMAKISKIV